MSRKLVHECDACRGKVEPSEKREIQFSYLAFLDQFITEQSANGENALIELCPICHNRVMSALKVALEKIRFGKS